MKKILFSLLLFCVYATAFAQQLSVKSVNLRPEDARARTNPRDDALGNKCAIIRVGVVGVENLVFPDAVGKVDRSLSEYIVYVPHGLKALRYKNNSGEYLGKVVFDDFGLDIESLASYDVIFESANHLRSAIFSVQPKDAFLTFDGSKCEIDKDGMAIINKPVGEYTYKVEAKGYIPQSGTVTLSDDDISTVTDIVLEEQLYPLAINVFPANATVFIDNVPYNKDALSNLQLTEGKHQIRVTATNYQDEETKFSVSEGMAPLYITLKQAKQIVVKHKEERTKTNINIRNAFYITGSFSMAGLSDISKTFSFGHGNARDYGGEISAVQHFGRLFSLREGIGLSFLKPNKNEKFFDISIYNDSTRYQTKVDIPLQVGVSFPFGKYNEHLFSVFGGGYGCGYTVQDKMEGEYALSEEEKQRIGTNKNSEDIYWDYGIRVSAKLDLWFITLGVDISQSIHQLGLSVGANLGVKLYTFKKKNKQ